MITANDTNMERLSDIMARVEKLSAERENERQAPSQASALQPEKALKWFDPVGRSIQPPMTQASAIHHQPTQAADTTTPASPAKVITISTRRRRQIESMILAREERERGEQQLVYSSRPFVLCGLPVKRPQKGVLKHIR